MPKNERWILGLGDKIIRYVYTKMKYNMPKNKRWILELGDKIIRSCEEDLDLDTYLIRDEFIAPTIEVSNVTSDPLLDTVKIPNLSWFIALRNAGVYDVV